MGFLSFTVQFRGSKGRMFLLKPLLLYFEPPPEALVTESRRYNHYSCYETTVMSWTGNVVRMGEMRNS